MQREAIPTSARCRCTASAIAPATQRARWTWTLDLASLNAAATARSLSPASNRKSIAFLSGRLQTMQRIEFWATFQPFQGPRRGGRGRCQNCVHMRKSKNRHIRQRRIRFLVRGHDVHRLAPFSRRSCSRRHRGRGLFGHLLMCHFTSCNVLKGRLHQQQAIAAVIVAVAVIDLLSLAWSIGCSIRIPKSRQTKSLTQKDLRELDLAVPAMSPTSPVFHGGRSSNQWRPSTHRSVSPCECVGAGQS